MGALISFIAVIILTLLAYGGVKSANMQAIFGIVLPYAAIMTFLIGVSYRVIKWAKSPVPYRITTTCGQQKTLPWIKQNKIENPSDAMGVTVRMILEVLLFRSLFRNTRSELQDGKLLHGSSKWLWLGGIAFHAAFFTVLFRHLRLFTEPMLLPLHLVETLDGFMQIGAPRLLMSGVVLLGAAMFLLLRRFLIPQVRYISLPADYFPLFLIIGIAVTGIMMRYVTKTDIVSVKELTMGLISLKPKIHQGVGAIFYIHLFLVSVLFAYFPFSKLVHMTGVFLSPTRNLANNGREVRHINPWNYKVKARTYEEYEDEFREKMKSANIPVEKE
ncbi:MAG: sulfate reduction electron transfer complex DsrMKJOP subunit DsrM [Nitrospirae bacterium]|nr:sulfate reduction electron transfer complex DsrMKJOP subunit DsrM [Nitrospirota bacterium]